MNFVTSLRISLHRQGIGKCSVREFFDEVSGTGDRLVVVRILEKLQLRGSAKNIYDKTSFSSQPFFSYFLKREAHFYQFQK